MEGRMWGKGGRKVGGKEGRKRKKGSERRKKDHPLSPLAPGLSDKVPIRGMDQQPLLILISLSGITT